MVDIILFDRSGFTGLSNGNRHTCRRLETSFSLRVPLWFRSSAGTVACGGITSSLHSFKGVKSGAKIPER